MNLTQVIANVVGKANKPNDPKELYFHWDEVNKVWCMSGTTVSGLYFETDDVPAESREDAEEQVVIHLTS